VSDGAREADVRAVFEVERKRCQAVVRRDIDVFQSLLADDMLHIHGTGLIEDKAAYLKGIASRVECKSSERSNLSVRFFGSVAVSTGDVTNIVRPLNSQDAWETVNAKATIVWAKDADTWKLVSFHACKLASS
jgi:ketosteroid isomerase-like protein